MKLLTDNLSLGAFSLSLARPAGYFCGINNLLISISPLLQKINSISLRQYPTIHGSAQQEASRCNQMQRLIRHINIVGSERLSFYFRHELAPSVFVRHEKSRSEVFFRILINKTTNNWNRFALPREVSFKGSVLYSGSCSCSFRLSWEWKFIINTRLQQELQNRICL